MSNFKAYGRISSDVEVAYRGSKNTAVASFSFAVNRKFKNADGKYEADFHRVQAWGKLAEVLEKAAKKGDRLVVEGDVQNNNYEDRNGTKHFGYIINCSGVDFVETKKDRESGSTQAQSTQTKSAEKPSHNRPQANTDNAPDDFVDVDDGGDIPFF
jgi:single-strand DNA-binding protein